MGGLRLEFGKFGKCRVFRYAKPFSSPTKLYSKNSQTGRNHFVTPTRLLDSLRVNDRRTPLSTRIYTYKTKNILLWWCDPFNLREVVNTRKEFFLSRSLSFFYTGHNTFSN